MAFAAWTTASVVLLVMWENAAAEYWLYGSVAVMPAFWCVYAWFASRRATLVTCRRLTLLAVPLLGAGLYALMLAVAAATQPPETRSYEYAATVIAGCCWEFSVPFGLISFIWAIVLQIRSLRQPLKEP